ncbi:MAG TPA: CNP1-like family protein [Ramlibacter sp.]|nr:CNP1-like family protein [Ramlibacter sp.]
MRREVTLAAVLLAACGSWAQTAPDFLPGTMGKPNQDVLPEWNEMEVPPPPALRTSDLVQVEVGGGGELRYGIDPQSLAVGKDGVVRYVLVASSRSGAVNALYEGVRCDRGEYRVYARSSGQGWRAVETQWKSLFEGVEGRHVRAVAKAGVCRGHTANGDAQQILRDLRTPQDRKFGGSSAS